MPEEMKEIFGVGDIWTWTAICADTKIVPCWRIDYRDANAANAFIEDLAGRLSNRVQLTTDGLRLYIDAIEQSFAGDIDYSQLIKLYGDAPKSEQKRYSPAKCKGIRKNRINGYPNQSHVSTSYVERQNLTMRMSMRRFTRLTNGFSKKVENHMHAISLHFMYYNFGRIHQTLRVTPAMEADISDHVWSLEEIANLVPEKQLKKRGPYKKKTNR